MPLCKLFGVSKQAYYKCDGSTSARKAAQDGGNQRRDVFRTLAQAVQQLVQFLQVFVAQSGLCRSFGGCGVFHGAILRVKGFYDGPAASCRKGEGLRRAGP